MSGRLTTIDAHEVRAIVLESGSVTIGRGEANHVVLEDDLASRVHARVDVTEHGIEITDLGSRNGTLVNGQRVVSARLGPGDEVEIGATRWRFEAKGSPAPPTGMLPTLNAERDLETAVRQTPLATIVADLSQPSLVVFEEGRTRSVPLTGEAIVIGRDPDADVTLEDPAVSRHHARVERVKGGFRLVDLQSSNGTFVADQRVDLRTLHDGDTIVVGTTRLAFKAGHPGLVLGEAELAERSARRPVVIVPGMMGSELWRGSERVWPNIRALERDAMALSAADDLEPRGIVNDVVVVPGLIKLDQYSRLGSFLCESLGYERGKDLLEYGYDWRRDVRDSARRLAATIDEWRAESSAARAPITIIAHSLGCLVTRYFAERCGGDRVADRLVFLGGPHQGVPQAIPMISGAHKLLPFGLLGERVRQTITTFPSVYQIIPVFPAAQDHRGRGIDVFEDESWVSDEHRHLLREARAFRHELPRRSSVSAVCVFGYGLDTVTGVRVREAEGSGWARVDVAVEPRGDEAIPEMSAVLEGADIHPVRQHHGSLYTDSDVKMRLVLELTRGVRPGRP